MAGTSGSACTPRSARAVRCARSRWRPLSHRTNSHRSSSSTRRSLQAELVRETLPLRLLRLPLVLVLALPLPLRKLVLLLVRPYRLRLLRPESWLHRGCLLYGWEVSEVVAVARL